MSDLFVLGEIKDCDKRAVAVVGSREMSDPGIANTSMPSFAA